MGGALGVVITNNVPVEGRRAVPVYVDDSLPIVGPARAIVVTNGEIPQAGGPPMAVRLAPAGTPAIGPALPVYVVAGSLSAAAVDPTLAYTNKVKALSPIAYWPLAEASGATATDESGNGRSGSYSNVTLGVAGIGDGRTAASFNGTTSLANMFTASLQGAFNGQEGTIAAWLKVANAGVWTDAATRAAALFSVNAANLIRLRKNGTNNTIACVYVAGGTSKTVAKASFSPTTFFHIAMTWSKAADQMIFYINGAQEGATQTGLGTFAGALGATTAVVGAESTAAAQWNGSIAHAALWATPLSAAQIATLAVVP